MIKIKNILTETCFENMPIVFLHAHPDDESFLTAGSISAFTEKNKNVYIVYAAAALVENKPETITRQQEALTACQILGTNNVIFLDNADELYKQDIQPVQNYLPNLLECFIQKLPKNILQNKFILISYDENGGYGHPDHVMVHKLGRFITKHIPNVMLYEVTLNRTHMDSWIKDAKPRLPHQLLPDLSFWSKIYGLAESEITHVLKLSNKAQTIKKIALGFHKSQIIPGTFPIALNNSDFESVFGCEYYHRV